MDIARVLDLSRWAESPHFCLTKVFFSYIFQLNYTTRNYVNSEEISSNRIRPQLKCKVKKIKRVTTDQFGVGKTSNKDNCPFVNCKASCVILSEIPNDSTNDDIIFHSAMI